MRSVTALLTAPLFGVALAVTQAIAAPSESGAYHIVVPRRAVRAGERVELRLEPPAPAGLRVNYWVWVGASGIGLNPYRAPYVIPVGTPPAKVSASFSGQGVRASVSTEIELQPGSMAGAEDCLGPGQSFSTVYGTIVPESVQLDVLPQLIHSVEPVYPRSDFARGVEDTIALTSLVCRSGHVLDAVALQRYRGGPGVLQPIEDDPKLVEAAIAAAKQYVYSPAMVAGQSVAVWVASTVIFRR